MHKVFDIAPRKLKICISLIREYSFIYLPNFNLVVNFTNFFIYKENLIKISLYFIKNIISVKSREEKTFKVYKSTQ